MLNKPTIIAAAQLRAEDENVEHNLLEHEKLIHLAAESSVQLLVFPEMSITGYVRETADRLAFSCYDTRLDKIRELAALHSMIIILGAPVRLSSALHVGAFIIYPDRSVSLYTKQFLYGNEKNFFIPNCGNNPLILLGQEKISLAICFDIENVAHVEKACDAGCTLYIASIFHSKASIAETQKLLGAYSKTYALDVLMANYSGYLYHTPAGGQSAFWSAGGDRLAGLSDSETGLVIAIKENESWTGKVVFDN